MTLTEILIIAATLAGPVTAVQAQKWIERAGERRRARLNIFYTLMGTRATRVAPDHVRALNMIDFEYHGWRSSDKRVIAAWRIYADNLNDARARDTEAKVTSWAARNDDLFFELLFEMSQALGFDFDRVQLRRGVYYPKGLGDTEAALLQIQQGLVGILSGERALAMKVTEFPTSQEFIAAQMAVFERSAKVYSEDGSMRVKIEGGFPSEARDRKR